MPRKKAIEASVTTFADHEVINPENKLRRAVKPVPEGTSPDELVTRAEAALAGLSSQFPSWMDEEIKRLVDARDTVKAKGISKAACEALFHAAHDIKGEAETFGFPLAAAPADSLCRLIEHTPEKRRIPFTLVDQHVDAVRAIVRESNRPDIGAVADSLTRKLRAVTDDFLARENHDHPDDLAEIFGPSLAPSGGE